jgi:uncharacterized protein
VIIRVSELDADGLTITEAGRLAHAYGDPGWRLDRVDVTVRPEGRDVRVHGFLTATVERTCGRCLEAFSAPVRADLDVRAVPRPSQADSVELAADDLDVDFYDADLLDLGRLIEAETALALPMKPLCRPDCRGLCPTCGANRNVTACACGDRAPKSVGARLSS